MSVYYKATRPDGTDFHSGTVDYAGALASGERVKVPRPAEGRMLCGPGVLHAATVPAETLVGGQWPCRLFAVEGRPLPLGYDDHPHKRGFASLRVVEELPAHDALGPNGEAVAALVDRSGRLTRDEMNELGAAWAAAWGAAWVAARGAARDAAWGAARGAARDAAWGAAWGAARDAAWGAALALVVRDLISPADFDLLYGPWASVIEGSR